MRFRHQQDATGNDAVATFTTGMNSVPAVTNNSTVTTVDTTAPTLTSAIVPANGDRVQFLFSETLQQSNLPPASAFTVTADGSAVTVSGIVADHLIDSNFIITLSPDITQGQTVVVTYTDPTSGDDALAIQDATGNDAATFTTGMNSVPAVTNNSTVNAAPTVATVIPDQTATAGTAFSYAFPDTTFSDADGDTLTYTATKADGTALPTWLSFSASTFSGTPQAADVGTVSVKVTASDGSASVSDTFDIVVSAAGDTTAPTLTSAIVPANGDLVQFRFSETLQQSNLPPASAFTVTADGSAVTVSGIAADHLTDSNFHITLSPDIRQGQTVVVTYTDPTSGDDANAIQDATGNDAATFTTGMNSVPAVTNNSTVNAAPAFSAAPQTRSIPENTAAGTNIGAAIPAATDTDGDTLTYSMEGTDAASFNFNASTRQITTKAGVTYDYETKSSYSVTIKADDGNGGTATIAVTINLTDVNEGTPPSTAHCDSSDPLELWCATLTVATTTFSGFTYKGYASGSDAYGSVAPNTFTYRTATISVSYLEYGAARVDFGIILNSGTQPAGGLLGPGTFTLEIGTGATKNSFAGVINPDLVPGTTNVFFWTDPGLSWSVGDAIPIKLLRGNAAPTVATVIPDQTATAATAFSYAFPATTFSDADGDTLTYTATKADGTALPTWLSFSASTFSGTPQAADVGTVSVKVTASDGSASVSDTFDIVVSAAGDTTAPTLTSAIVPANGDRVQFLFSETLQQSNLPPASAFTVTADGSAVTVSGIVADHLIDSNFIITLSPDITQGQTVVVTYTDPTSGDDANAIQDATGNDAATFTTGMNSVPAVTNNSTVNAAPTVATVIPDQTATAGTAFSYAFPATTFSDADGDTLTYTATKADGTALPTWLSFSASTFSGTPQAADVGTVSVKVTASDGSASVSDTFDIVVSAAGDTTAPTLTSAIVPANGDWVQFLFSETLQQSNLPPASAFTVTADGSAVTVSGIVADHLIDSNFHHHAFA